MGRNWKNDLPVALRRLRLRAIAGFGRLAMYLTQYVNGCTPLGLYRFTQDPGLAALATPFRASGLGES
jgi:hypothetical protein